MFRAGLQRLFYGRSGPDALSSASVWAALAAWVVYLFTRFLVFYIICMALMGYSLFRMLSRRVDRRRAENAKFLALVRPVRQWWSGLVCRLRDREHMYFSCPNCGQRMRVPRGKGRIQVTCRSCGITFEEKS